MTYYHVCAKWDGGKLESLYKQHGEDAYEMFASRWPESSDLGMYHADLIHLHSTLDEAREFADEFGGEILEVNDPDNELDIRLDTLEYPHPVARGSIDKDYVKSLTAN